MYSEDCTQKLSLAGAEALHPSDKGERGEGGLKERCEHYYGGQGGRILYDLILFCQCNVSPGCLLKAEDGRLVAGVLAGTLEREK